MTTFTDIDRANERAVLGAVMLSDRALKPLVTQHGLRPEHFHADGHIFAAMLAVSDRGEPVTANTLATELARHGTPIRPEILADLAAECGPIHELPAVARAVREAHEWRTVQDAAAGLLNAAKARDPFAREQAEALLSTPADQEPRTHTAQQVRERAVAQLESPEAKPKGVPFPFDRLNRGGGMRPSQLTVLGARQKQGKSVVADMCIDQAAKHAAGLGWVGEPHLYLLEMSEAERVERFQARLALVNYDRIVSGDLTDEERDRLLSASGRIPCGMTDAAGWSPQQVIRHARMHGFRFVVVDHMHCFQLREEADVADCVRQFRDFAAQEQAHVILCAQLNEKRVQGQQRPRPTLTDLRGSGMIAAFAHYVTFVFRPDDEKGREGDEGEIWHAACRSGRPYLGERVVLRGEWMRFEVDESDDWRSRL